MIDFVGNGVTILPGNNSGGAGIIFANSDGLNPSLINALETAGFIYGYSPSRGTWDRLRATGDQYDAIASVAAGVLNVESRNLIYNGANWDRNRTQNIFVTAKITAAGSTALYTAAAGDYWRLMAYTIEFTGDAAPAATGDVDAQFFEGATALPIAHSIYCVAAGNTIADRTETSLKLGNGLLAAATGSTLNIDLSAALTTGYARVNVALCTGPAG